MNLELVGALNELEKERGISKDILLEAIEAAIVSAYKRNYGTAQNVRVEVDEKTGRMQVFAQKDVVSEVMDAAAEISLEEAKRIDPNYELNDVVEVEVTPRDFGRIAAQTAKQVVIQRIREAERSLVYEEYANREGDIVTGIVQRTEHRNVLVDLGKVEAVMPPPEQMPGEPYYHGNRLKVYITEVRKTTKGPQVYVSRTHPGLLKRLFELEVPEIHDGTVEIKAVAREAGNRSKVAVVSHDENVDPVGACVGPRGIRVQAVVQELRGEKIDIVQWDPLPERFVGNALSPAKVVRVYCNYDEKAARAVVPDHQLSLAIGKEGQNARLAARLTGWKIDIKSETQHQELAVLEAHRAFEEAEAALRAKREREAALAAAAQTAEPVVEPPAPAEEIEEAEVLAPAAGPAEPADELQAAPGAAQEVLAEPVEPAAETEPPAEEAEEFGDFLDIEDLQRILEEEERRRAALPAVKGKKSRAAKKQELQEVFEEVLEDEEPLPTLFDAAEAEAEKVAPPEPAPVGTRDGGKARKKKAKGKGKEAAAGGNDDRPVLRDLAQLADVDLEEL